MPGCLKAGLEAYRSLSMGFRDYLEVHGCLKVGYRSPTITHNKEYTIIPILKVQDLWHNSSMGYK